MKARGLILLFGGIGAALCALLPGNVSGARYNTNTLYNYMLWTDPHTGCQYFAQKGMILTVRRTAEGRPMCPRVTSK